MQAVEVGCGVMGRLRILSRRVGAQGHTTATKVDEQLLASAQALCEEQFLANVGMVLATSSPQP